MEPKARGALFFVPEPTLYYELRKKGLDGSFQWVGDFGTREEAARHAEPFLADGIDCSIKPLASPDQ
jgi:hypothetical protein